MATSASILAGGNAMTRRWRNGWRRSGRWQNDDTYVVDSGFDEVIAGEPGHGYRHRPVSYTLADNENLTRRSIDGTGNALITASSAPSSRYCSMALAAMTR
jgi:hypothetical protein